MVEPLWGADQFLLYLYLELEGEVGAPRRMELERFDESVGEEIGFRALSYDEIFARLRELGGEERGEHVAYVESRYGGP